MLSHYRFVSREIDNSFRKVALPVIQISVVEAVLNHPLPYPMEMIAQPMSISHTPENSSRSINEFSRTINKLFLRSGEETTIPIDYVPLLSTTKRYVADSHMINFI